MAGDALPPAGCHVANVPEEKWKTGAGDTFGRDHKILVVQRMGFAMKFSVEIDRKSLRVLCAFALALAAFFAGGERVVESALSLYLILKG